LVLAVLPFTMSLGMAHEPNVYVGTTKGAFTGNQVLGEGAARCADFHPDARVCFCEEILLSPDAAGLAPSSRTIGSGWCLPRFVGATDDSVFDATGQAAADAKLLSCDGWSAGAAAPSATGIFFSNEPGGSTGFRIAQCSAPQAVTCCKPPRRK
jgi:hypothetical protein